MNYIYVSPSSQFYISNCHVTAGKKKNHSTQIPFLPSSVMTFSYHCFVPIPQHPMESLHSLYSLLSEATITLPNWSACFLSILQHAGRVIFLKFKANHTTFLLKTLQ